LYREQTNKMKLPSVKAASKNGVAFGLIASQIIIAAVLWMFCPIAALPKPPEIFSAWLDLVNNNAMINQLCISIIVNVQSIILSLVITLSLTYLSMLPKGIGNFCNPVVNLISKFRFFSLTGFIFLFTILFGIGHGLKVSLLTFGLTVFYLTSTLSIVNEIPKEEFDHARTLRYNEWEVIWEVVVLGRLDYVCEALRQNAAMGWVMLTMVEGLSRGEGGIGKLLLDENKHFRLEQIFAIQITILIIGFMQDKIINLIKKTCFRYSELGKVNR